MGFDWDRAAKADYVRRHGAEPYRIGLARGDADERRLVQKEADLRNRLATSVDLVAEFAKLTPIQRRARYHLYLSRLLERFTDERRRLTRSEAPLFKAIDEYEQGTIALLKGVLSVQESGGQPTVRA